MSKQLYLIRCGSSEVLSFALSELARYLCLIDPTLSVVCGIDESPSAAASVIYVGRSETLAAALPPLDNAEEVDAVVISVQDGSGYITGSNDRSVLIAVYRFLRELGCCFVRPGAEGERISRRDLSCISAEIVEIASRRHRGVCIEGAVSYENVAEMIDFLPKVGLNEYFIQFFVPGTFFNRWYGHESNPMLSGDPLSREELIAFTASLEKEIHRRGLGYHKVGHGWTCEPFGLDGSDWDSQKKRSVPEELKPYLAQIDGKRELWRNVPLNTNLCYGNPAVRNKITDAIVNYTKENPTVSMLHFWLADGANNHCECERCTASRPADLYVQMLNELDEKLSAAKLPVKIVFLIYNDLLWEPLREKIRNPDRFVLMFAPITRRYGDNYGHSLAFTGELPPYNRNHLSMPGSLSRNLEHLRRWQRDFDGDSFVFDYHLMWAHVGDPGYEKCARNLFEDMRDLSKIGLDGMVSCQVQRCFFPTALPLNMMASALWNAEGDYDTQANAYYRAAFGEDGTILREHLTAVSELFQMYRWPVPGERGPYCSDYKELEQMIQTIRTLAEKNLMRDDMYSKEWSHLPLYCDYLSLLSQALQAREQGETEKSQRHFDALKNCICKEEMSVQKLLDVHNTLKVLRRRFP